MRTDIVEEIQMKKTPRIGDLIYIPCFFSYGRAFGIISKVDGEDVFYFGWSLETGQRLPWQLWSEDNYDNRPPYSWKSVSPKWDKHKTMWVHI